MLVLIPIPDCPVPFRVPPEDVRVNQLAAGAILVFQATGHTQPPIPVNMTFCVAGLADAPCTALKDSALDQGCDMVQGGCNTRFTVIV
jgi:hypothetical protein